MSIQDMTPEELAKALYEAFEVQAEMEGGYVGPGNRDDFTNVTLDGSFDLRAIAGMILGYSPETIREGLGKIGPAAGITPPAAPGPAVDLKGAPLTSGQEPRRRFRHLDVVEVTVGLPSLPRIVQATVVEDERPDGRVLVCLRDEPGPKQHHGTVLVAADQLTLWKGK